MLKNVIIVKKKKNFETWSSFTDLCKAHGLPYHSIKMNAFPMKINGIIKVKHNVKTHD